MNEQAILTMRQTVRFHASRLARTWKSMDRRDFEQDGYVAILEALPRYDGRTKLTTFMRYRVAGGMIDGLRRWNPRRTVGLPDNAAELWKADTPNLTTRLQMGELRLGFESLSRRQRRILRARFVDGESWGRIATRLGVCIRTIHSDKLRAFEQLRERLGA